MHYFEMSFRHPTGQHAALHAQQVQAAGMDARHDPKDHHVVHVGVEGYTRMDAGMNYMSAMIRHHGPSYKHPGTTLPSIEPGTDPKSLP